VHGPQFVAPKIPANPADFRPPISARRFPPAKFVATFSDNQTPRTYRKGTSPMSESSSSTPNEPRPDQLEPKEAPNRRGFVTRAAAVVIGGLVGLVPLVSGLLVFLDPLRRKSAAGELLRVTTLDSVPADGIARYFPVVTDKTDAWNRYPDEPVGAVFLRRVAGSNEVQCFNAICPHAGCFVDFKIPDRDFHCPCHDSRWKADGVRIDPDQCPSPRDLDSLVVDQEKLKDGEVWVDFKNFLTATPEKIAKG
jgi:menaquinol-cytochrome c reductase iron-sulfur subunit